MTCVVCRLSRSINIASTCIGYAVTLDYMRRRIKVTMVIARRLQTAVIQHLRQSKVGAGKQRPSSRELAFKTLSTASNCQRVRHIRLA